MARPECAHPHPTAQPCLARAVNAHICRLRRALELFGVYEMAQTGRGNGYRFSVRS